MSVIPAVDQSADFQFVSRSAGNTPDKVKAALEGEGIFIKDISEQSDGSPEIQVETGAPPSSEEEAKAVEPVPGETVVAEKTEDQKAEEERRKAAPGAKERLKAKLQSTTAELTAEKERRESLERELEEFRKGKSASPIEPPVTQTPTVAKTEETPAEPKPRPKRPKQDEFWEDADPEAAFEAAVTKYEDELVDWRTEETARVKRTADQEARQKEATETFGAATEAEQRERAVRYTAQATEFIKTHPDYKEKLEKLEALTPAMLEAIHSVDDTVAIAYYLASNPEEHEALIKATKLPDRATQGQVSKAMKKAFDAYTSIAAKIAAQPAASATDDEIEADDEPGETVTEKVADKPVAAEPPAVSAEPVAAPKKFTPVTPVGGRGGRSTKSIDELARSQNNDDLNEIRNMPLDEFRKRKAG